ncbi:phospholipase A1 member A isoform X2 [Tachysurus fulvidraco]|uniref:phospholipase A1 member A isoform X2 n=1 Tax=Tachysurus fulvidraco TaxID=1234273 RepID=UPI000F4FFA5B|nr:phospholipase A1 member A isoform X2 [Tachysurus fulvidraco]
MTWKWVNVICTLLSLFTSVVGNTQDKIVNVEESMENCADFNNTTYEKYRNMKGVYVQYLLLTRRNADCASLFTQDCLNHTQNHTVHFTSTLPTKVIIHGYRVLGRKPSWVSGLAQALLEKEDANILVVDWLLGASYAYNNVVDNYKEVAVQISILINQLSTSGVNLELFHLIGISLGAHVAGFVGTLFKGKLGRITGLDPAGPMFKNADPFDRLDPSDAMFVEAIHTDSDKFGISIPVGHVDFFVNGGLDQTGCVQSSFTSIYGYVICDHMRALHVYMSALNGFCALTGFPCSSYEAFLAGQCTSCDGVFNNICPQIGLLKNSGITASPLPIHGKVYLLTTSEVPFCVHHIMIELKVSQLEKTAVVVLTLVSMQDIKTEQKLYLNKDKTIYKKVIGYPEPLCKIESIHLKNTGALLYRQGNIHFEYVCVSTMPKMRRTDTLCVENIMISRRTPWSHDLIQVC